MTAAAQGDSPPSALLGPLVEFLPDLFRKEVLRRLGPTDLASLAGVGRGFAAAVAATALMQWAKHVVKRKLIRLQPLCWKEACEHAAGDGNMEVLEWLHSTGCPLGRAVHMDLSYSPC